MRGPQKRADDEIRQNKGKRNALIVFQTSCKLAPEGFSSLYLAVTECMFDVEVPGWLWNRQMLF